MLRASRYPSCSSFPICPVVAFQPSSVIHSVICPVWHSSVCLSTVVQRQINALLFRALPLVIATLNLSCFLVLRKKYWVGGTAIHSGVSSSCSCLRAMRDMNICGLGISFVVCQYLSSLVLGTGSGSSLRFAIAVVVVSAPVPRIHKVRVQSHVDASRVRFTIFAPTILGLTCVLGIGEGVALVSFVPSEEIKARRAIGNFELEFRMPALTWLFSVLCCSFVHLLEASSFLHSLSTCCISTTCHNPLTFFLVDVWWWNQSARVPIYIVGSVWVAS